jgi:hypothetical protein
VVSVKDPYGRILGFIDRSRYFSISSSSVVLTRMNGPRSRPTTFLFGSAKSRTRASGPQMPRTLTTRPQNIYIYHKINRKEL